VGLRATRTVGANPTSTGASYSGETRASQSGANHSNCNNVEEWQKPRVKRREAKEAMKVKQAKQKARMKAQAQHLEQQAARKRQDAEEKERKRLQTIREYWEERNAHCQLRAHLGKQAAREGREAAEQERLRQQQERLRQQQERLRLAVSLLQSCSQGRIADVRRLLGDGVNPKGAFDEGSWHSTTDGSWKKYEGKTPLMLACEGGHTEIAALLIAAGAQPERTLMHAARTGKVGCARLLIRLETADNPWSARMLFHTLKASSTLPAGVLLEAGARPTHVDALGWTCLHLACMLPDEKPTWHCIRSLVAVGSDVDAVLRDGATPLYIATKERAVGSIKALIDANADPNIALHPNIAHWFPGGEHVGLATPLHKACCAAEAATGCAAAVRLLMEARANLNIQNVNGHTPLDVACLWGPRARACASLLCSAGPEANRGSNRGSKALKIACQIGELRTLRLCLEAGFDVDFPSDQPPMLVACQRGRVDHAKLLSSYSAARVFASGLSAEAACHISPVPQSTLTPSQRNKSQLREWLERTRDWTPLHHLEQLNAVRARQLIDGGASVHARPNGLPSPLQRVEEERMEVSMVCSPCGCNGHMQHLDESAAEGWMCDGADHPAGCVQGCTGFNQTAGWTRWQCKLCEYDLCEGCFRRAKSNLLQAGDTLPQAIYRASEMWPYGHVHLSQVRPHMLTSSQQACLLFLLWVGRQLSTRRSEGEQQVVRDVWEAYVIPYCF